MDSLYQNQLLDKRYNITVDDSIDKMSVSVTTKRGQQGPAITLKDPSGELNIVRRFLIQSSGTGRTSLYTDIQAFVQDLHEQITGVFYDNPSTKGAEYKKPLLHHVVIFSFY